MRIVDLFSGAGGLTFGFYYRLKGDTFVRNRKNTFVFANEYNKLAGEAFAANYDFAHNPIHLKDGVLVLTKKDQDINFTENDIEEIRRKLSAVEKDLLELIPAKKADGESAIEDDKLELALI